MSDEQMNAKLAAAANAQAHRAQLETWLGRAIHNIIWGRQRLYEVPYDRHREERRRMLSVRQSGHEAAAIGSV